MKPETIILCLLLSLVGRAVAELKTDKLQQGQGFDDFRFVLENQLKQLPAATSKHIVLLS